MKIIQSFWSGNQNDFSNACGWESYRYNWMSWILSCYQLVKYHKNVELYTDAFGYKILIEKLKLPYTKVHVVLDEVNHYPKDFWAIAKIKTFQQQEEPFLHVDGDVFVWESLTNHFHESNLVVQSMEVTDYYYQNIWSNIYPELEYLPKELAEFHNDKTNVSFNMGIVGGNNVEFFKNYCSKSFEFVNLNKKSWSRINGLHYNVFFEQLLFCKYAQSKKQEVDFLFPEIPIDNEYFGFADFHEVPHKTYLHLLGNYKKEPAVCKFMELYLMKNYPEAYSNLGAVINEFTGSSSENDYLNPEFIQRLECEFQIEIRKNSFSSGNFLLKRDLNNSGLHQRIEELFLKRENFSIVKLKGFEFKRNTSPETDELDYLVIEEINSAERKYKLDEFDEILLDELQNPILYSDLLNVMKEYLEEHNEESLNELSDVLNAKLKNYIKLKIISIYN
ncbi:hypothetical protein GCM10022422_30750 [Flavobacterium ginsengisoli]|uniref:DUF6734 domain-containing protein n=1 Tax=Flavobacterium ginsengisoli TaxID=871694 RepID=A0ABP7FPK1_9FLAO